PRPSSGRRNFLWSCGSVHRRATNRDVERLSPPCRNLSAGEKMRESDRIEFVKVVGAMAEFKRVEVSPDTFEIWWDCMSDWEIADFKVAARQLMKTLKWMPSPHDFEQLRKAGRPTPGEAWARALAYAASSRYRSKPEMGDELIDAAVRMIGGYQAIGMTDEDKLHFVEHRFCEHYEQLEDR